MVKDFGTTLIYLTSIMTIDKPSLVFFFPISLFFIIGFSQFVLKSE